MVALTAGVADGRCIIEAVLVPEEDSASLSYQDAFFGALTVIRSCILNKRFMQGGMATDIGRLPLYKNRSTAG